MAETIRVSLREDNFYSKICWAMSSKGLMNAKGIYGNGTSKYPTKNLRGKWEGFHLLYYGNYVLADYGRFTEIKDPEEIKKNKQRFDGILKKNGIPEGIKDFQGQPTSGGAGIERCENYFRALAEYQSKMPLLQCFVDFIVFCKDNNFPLQAVKDEEKESGAPYDEILERRIYKYKVQLTNCHGKFEEEQKSENQEVTSKKIPNNDNIATTNQPNLTASIALQKNKLPDRFKEKVDFLTSEYYERSYISGEINDFFKNHDRGHVTIHGKGGTGKSAILAHSVKKFQESHQFDCVWYFVEYGADTSYTYSFLKDIYEIMTDRHDYDLSSLHDEYIKILPNTFDNYGRFFRLMIQELSRQIEERTHKPLIFIIDALDEISENDPIKKSGRENFLAIPRESCKGIYFLVSSRNERQQDYSVVKRLYLDNRKTGQPEHHQIEDVRGYVEYKYESDGDIKAWADRKDFDKNSFVKVLSEKSEYCFIYLYHVFSKIDEFNDGELPQGIENYYLREYNRLGLSDSLRKAVISGIANFQPQISIERLSVFCGVQDVIETYNFISKWEEIRLIKASKSDSTYYRFSHLSFYDFLIKNKNAEIFDPVIYVQSYKRLADDLSSCVKLSSKENKLEILGQPGDELRKETLKLLLDASLKAGQRDVKYLDMAADYLSNRIFCNDYLRLLSESASTVLNKVEETVTLYEKFEKGKAGSFIRKFILDVESLNTKKPIIDADIITNHLRHNPKSSATRIYEEQKAEIMNSKNNRPAAVRLTEADMDTLRAMEPQELKNSAGFIRNELRGRGLLDEAVQQYMRYCVVYEERLGSGITCRDIARLYWEMAIIEHMRGYYERAVHLFEKNNEYSERDGDELGVVIGLFDISISKQALGEISPQERYIQNVAHLQAVLALRNQGYEESRCQNWIHTISVHLTFSAIEIGDVEAARNHFEDVNNHPLTINNLNKEPVSVNTLLIMYSLEGALYFLEQEYIKSLSIYAKFLNTDLSGWGVRDESIAPKSTADYNSVAQGYMYAGKCLLALKKTEEAKEVFFDGLSCDKNKDNLYYQGAIKKILMGL